MPEPAILRECRGAVEILTINRPHQRNAVNVEVARGLATALDELASDPENAVVIITATGDKAFCAGLDLRSFAAGEVPLISSVSGGFAGIVHRSFPKPIIAAVNGAALAGGFEVVMSCDLVVAAEHAVFGIPEVKRGLVAAAGGLVRLPRRIPIAVALEMALTGDPIDAHRAYELGLANRVVPKEKLLEEALQMAGIIAGNAPMSVRMSKHVMRVSASTSESQGWASSDEARELVFQSADAREGALAFVEKRSPVWTGVGIEEGERR